jgi:hypothetical protein
MKDNFGDNKILPENVLDEYIKNKNNVNHFVDLFGKNPQAMGLMQDHVFDAFKNAVVKDGVIDPSRYAKFLSDKKDILNVLDKAGLPTLGKMDSAVAMTQKFSDRAATLAQQEKDIANSKLVQALKTKDIDLIAGEALASPQVMGRLTTSLGQEGSQALASKIMRDMQERIVYPLESGKVGLNTGAMADFLTSNDKALRVMFRAAYGAKEGSAHLDRLETAYKMMAIQDRVGLPKASEVSGVGVDPLKAATNVSLTSLWSMARAVFRGVNSPENMAIVLGGQAASGFMNKAYNNLMMSIASDPQSSKRLLDLVKTGGKSAPAMTGLLGKLGYFWLGGRYYGPSMSIMAPGIGETIEENKRKQEAKNAVTAR